MDISWLSSYLSARQEDKERASITELINQSIMVHYSEKLLPWVLFLQGYTTSIPIPHLVYFYTTNERKVVS